MIVLVFRSDTNCIHTDTLDALGKVVDKYDFFSPKEKPFFFQNFVGFLQICSLRSHYFQPVLAKCLWTAARHTGIKPLPHRPRGTGHARTVRAIDGLRQFCNRRANFLQLCICFASPRFNSKHGAKQNRSDGTQSVYPLEFDRWTSDDCTHSQL